MNAQSPQSFVSPNDAAEHQSAVLGSNQIKSYTVSLPSTTVASINSSATRAAELPAQHKSHSAHILPPSPPPSLSFSSTSSQTVLPDRSSSNPIIATTDSSSTSTTTTSSSSPTMLQTPSLNTTRSSTMSISSLLSESSTPTLTRRSSFSESATESDHEEGGSETSEDIEAATPTPEDIALMSVGSQASAMLKRIQENFTDLEDIIELLVSKMAILILPTCSASVSEPTRSTFEDHVITPKSQDSEWLFETLSGIRLKPTSVSSIAILDPATGNGEGTSTITKTSQPAIISLVPKSEESRPVTNGSRGTELRLVNTSASPIQISIPSVGPVSVLLVNGIIPAPSVRSHYTVPPKRPAATNSNPSSTTDPLKKRRRRRITTEEASRVIIEGSEDDPNARARYKCSECDKTFSRPFNLRSHRATHAGIKPYKCTFIHGNGVKCHWEFARRHDLDRHMSSRHSFEKPFKCGTCGATCGRNDSLKRHYEKNPTCAEAASRGLAPQPQPQPQTRPLSLSSAPTPTQTPPPSLPHPIFNNNHSSNSDINIKRPHQPLQETRHDVKQEMD